MASFFTTLSAMVFINGPTTGDACSVAPPYRLPERTGVSGGILEKRSSGAAGEFRGGAARGREFSCRLFVSRDSRGNCTFPNVRNPEPENTTARIAAAVRCAATPVARCVEKSVPKERAVSMMKSGRRLFGEAVGSVHFLRGPVCQNTSRTSMRCMPLGDLNSTLSPPRLPNTARPKGELNEMLPELGSAS